MVLRSLARLRTNEQAKRTMAGRIRPVEANGGRWPLGVWPPSIFLERDLTTYSSTPPVLERRAALVNRSILLWFSPSKQATSPAGRHTRGSPEREPRYPRRTPIFLYYPNRRPDPRLAKPSPARPRRQAARSDPSRPRPSADCHIQ